MLTCMSLSSGRLASPVMLGLAFPSLTVTRPGLSGGDWAAYTIDQRRPLGIGH